MNIYPLINLLKGPRSLVRPKSSQREIFYHCMSRTINGEHLFNDREREIFRQMIHKVAGFSGVEVLTFCVMSNHFHLLIRVPPQNQTMVSDDEIVRRYSILYNSPSPRRFPHPEEIRAILNQQDQQSDLLRAYFHKRMHDVSHFMKLLKQRFSHWFNKTHGRFGPLWSSRYHSVLVEGSGEPLLTMALYIDLNPVRAGIVTDPRSYRFSGIGEFAHNLSDSKDRFDTIFTLICTTEPDHAPTEYLRLLKEALKQRPLNKHSLKPGAALLTSQSSMSHGLIMGSKAFLKKIIEDFPQSVARRTAKKLTSARDSHDSTPSLHHARKCRRHTPRPSSPERPL